MATFTFALAASGTFPGQARPRLVFPASQAAPYDFQAADVKDYPGLRIDVPVNRQLFQNGAPRRLRVQMSVLPPLSAQWELTNNTDLLHRPSSSAGYRLDGNGTAFLIDLKRLPLAKGAELVDLLPEGDYLFTIILKAKTKTADLRVPRDKFIDDARKQILDDGKLTVIEDDLP